MYGYALDIKSNVSEIFQKISQEEVFKHIFGNFIINQYIKSPFRTDTTPGCWITWGQNGKLYFCDYTLQHPRLDMIDIVQKYYNLKFNEALDFIISGNWEKVGKYTFIEKLKRNLKNEPTPIQFCPKPFDKYQKKYWSSYDISSSQLVSDNIFPTAWYRIYSHTHDKWITVTPHPQEVTYTISLDDAVKICRPNTHDKKFKWITNVSKNTIGGITSLQYLADTLVITKSYKDWRVLTNLGVCCIWLQNEGMIPDWDVLEKYITMYPNIVIWFDNDYAGVQASIKLKDFIDLKYPNKTRIITLSTNEKDPADVIKAGKKEVLINFIQQENLLI